MGVGVVRRSAGGAMHGDEDALTHRQGAGDPLGILPEMMG